MKKTVSVIIALLMAITFINAVTVFEQSFSVTTPPAGWNIQGYKTGGSHTGNGTPMNNTDFFTNETPNYLRLTKDTGYNRAWAYYSAAKFPVMGKWKITMEIRIGKTHDGTEIDSGADGLCLVFADANTCETDGALDMTKVEGGYGEFEGAPHGVTFTSPAYLVGAKGYHSGFKGFSFEFDHYNNTVGSEVFREYIHWVDLSNWEHSGLGANMATDTGFYYNDGWQRVQLDADAGVITFRYNWNGTSSTYASSITLNTNSPINSNCNDIYAYDAYLGISAGTGGESAYHEVRYMKLENETDENNTPVELSSFTAIQNSENFAQVNWTTQSETGVRGYYIYRGTAADLQNAKLVSPLINAHNTSVEHSYQFIDAEITNPGTYYYWLQNSDLDGAVDFHGPISINYVSQGGSTPGIPLFTELEPIFPNPFNPLAFIPFSLKESASVNIEIYNNRGQLMRSIPIGVKAAGHYQSSWDGNDDQGNNCGTGIYYIRMTAGSQSFSRKAVMMK